MLEKQVLNSVGWSTAGVWLRALLSIVSLVILARLLEPADYGAFALAYLVVGAAALLAGGPLAEAIIQKDARDGEFEQATFWLTVSVGLTSWVVAALTAPVWASVLRAPALTQLIPVFGALSVAVALSALPAAVVMRDLRYDLLNTIEIVATAIAACVGISSAALGAGAWSLVAMEMTYACGRGLGLWRTSGFSTGLAPLFARWPDVWRANWGSAGAWGLRYAVTQLPRAIIGGMLGATVLGLFVFANRFFERVAGLLLQPIGSVALSAVSRAQNDRATLHRLLENGLRLSSMVCAPAFLGLAAIAPLLIPAAFGDRWTTAVLPTQLLLLIGLRAAIGAFNISILRGVGQQAAPVGLLAFELIGLALILPFAAPHGLVAACFGILSVEFAAAPLAAALVSRATGFSIKAQILAAGPGLLAAMSMALIVVGLRRGIEDAVNPWVAVLACVISGAALYGALIWTSTPSATATVLRYAKSIRSGAAND
ncbi:MAG: oligosaccharide flippase family protein [Pseudomonadota bacterium]